MKQLHLFGGHDSGEFQQARTQTMGLSTFAADRVQGASRILWTRKAVSSLAPGERGVPEESVGVYAEGPSKERREPAG